MSSKICSWTKRSESLVKHDKLFQYIGAHQIVAFTQDDNKFESDFNGESVCCQNRE